MADDSLIEPLTPAEQRAIEMTADLWNLLVREVVGDGPSREEDCRELASAIHTIQRMVGAQAAARAYPTKFRLLGETLRT